MVYEAVKSRIEEETIRVDYCNNDLIDKDVIEGEYFGLPIHKRNYPSCYQYNVIVMLAKRLIKEDRERTDRLSNRMHLDRKITERIFSLEE